MIEQGKTLQADDDLARLIRVDLINHLRLFD